MLRKFSHLLYFLEFTRSSVATVPSRHKDISFKSFVMPVPSIFMVLQHLTNFNDTIFQKGFFLLNQGRQKVCFNGVQLASKTKIGFHYKILHLKELWL